MSRYDPYLNTLNENIELDLRQEMERLMEGASDEVAKGKIGLLRKMQRDDNGDLVRCSCRNKLTDEPSRDYYCRYCLNEGYFWNETKIVYHKNDNSFQHDGNESSYKFYFEYTDDITVDDAIIEILLSDNGNPVSPIKRIAYYNIYEAEQFRSDNGRTEFWQVKAEYKRNWSTWYGVKLRQDV